MDNLNNNIEDKKIEDKKDKKQNRQDDHKHSELRNKIVILGGEILLILGIALTFIYFCYSIKSIISPVILLILLIAGLLPFWRFMWAKTLLAIVLSLFILWTINSAGYLVAPFIIGGLLAYLFDPLITKLEKKFPRIIGVLIIFIPLVAFAFVFSFFILPRLFGEIKRFLEYLPFHSAKIANSLVDISIKITEWFNINIPGENKFDFVVDDKAITNFLFGVDGIFDTLYNSLSTIKINSITKIFSIIFSYFVLLPFITFYFMLDFQRIKGRLIKLIPVRWQENFEYVFSNSNQIINNYIRGMTILAASFFVITFILLLLTNTKYALILALCRGLFNYIPFIGPFVAFLLALISAVVTDVIWWHGAIKMCLVYGVIQIIDSGFLAPKVLGRSVLIHPIAVMFGSIIGGVLFGFLGVLAAIPFIGILLLLLKRFSYSYFNSKFYSSKRKH